MAIWGTKQVLHDDRDHSNDDSLLMLLLPFATLIHQTMFSAAFIGEPASYDAEFNELNAIIDALALALAKASPGFLGVEAWASDDGKRRNATCYWGNMDSLKAFASIPSHIEAKQKYAQWYLGYHVVISEVIKSYGDAAFQHLTPTSGDAS